jgi:hypothetical protein
MVKKYGLTLFTSADESLEAYIQSVMKQVQGELLESALKKRELTRALSSQLGSSRASSTAWL